MIKNMEEIKDLIQRANEQIKNNTVYSNYELQYILSRNSKITDIIYADDTNVINLNLDSSKIKKFEKEYSVLDEILLPEIEKGKQIEFISDETHDWLWYIIETYYPDDLENKKGMFKYLEYCKKNNITRKYLDEKFDSSPSDLLDLYDKLHDYFRVDDLQVVMSKDVFEKRREANYFTFVLGYDLLHKMIEKYENLDCDSYYPLYIYISFHKQSDYYLYNIHYL